MADRPLRGIRVLDLTNVLAGPFACHQLAHMGGRRRAHRRRRSAGAVDAAARDGHVGGRFAAIARAVEDELAARKGGRRIPMNIDGATAVIYAELGFPAPLARGLFCLSRSVGILAHAWEQTSRAGATRGRCRANFRGPTAGRLGVRYPDGARYLLAGARFGGVGSGSGSGSVGVPPGTLPTPDRAR